MNGALAQQLVERSLDGAQNETRHEAPAKPQDLMSAQEAHCYLEARFRWVLDQPGPKRPRWTLTDALAVRALLGAAA